MYKIISCFTINESLEQIKKYDRNIIIKNDDYINIAIIIELINSQSTDAILFFKNDNGLSPITYFTNKMLLLGFDNHFVVVDTENLDIIFNQKVDSLIFDIKVINKNQIVIVMESDVQIISCNYVTQKKYTFPELINQYNFFENKLEIITIDNKKYAIEL